MKPSTIAFGLLLSAATLFGACKKSEKDPTPKTEDLKAGQCTISFKTDKDFNGTTAISIPPGATTSAVRVNTAGSYEQITLTANMVNTGSLKSSTAQLTILLPQGSGGNTTVPFESSAGSPNAVLVISNLDIGASVPAYASETGTVTITSLTSTGVEGTFSAHAINEDQGTSINISEGKFAGKF